MSTSTRRASAQRGRAARAAKVWRRSATHATWLVIAVATSTSFAQTSSPTIVRELVATWQRAGTDLLDVAEAMPENAAGTTTWAIGPLVNSATPPFCTNARSGRRKVAAAIGGALRGIEPGSAKAAEVKRVLQAEGLWSPYLEVGIGPDAEVFTKGPVLSAVGWGADIGLHPVSTWNNPEPEVVLAIASTGRIVGATLGNDVNLRDVEGRSALLLSKAKDNNASAALGPFVRLFDDGFSLEDVSRVEVGLAVEGKDGFSLEGASSMSRISRSPAELVAAAMGPHHQYPDGMALYLGTMFVPSKDRDRPGSGFTHKSGDIVTISAPGLGRLVNRVRLSTECAPWAYGASHLMRDLARAELI